MRGGRVVLGVGLVLLAGCGDKAKVVPVSGRVTINGKPAAGVSVTFQPIAPAGSAETGPAAGGKTDGDGRFTLTALSGESGAWVGKHKVLFDQFGAAAGELDPRPGRGGSGGSVNKIPFKYNRDSQEAFEVLAEGTTEANFDLKIP
jgi:hypothetical protein